MSARPAHFSKTKILTMPLKNGNHFTAYENNAENLSKEPNCMILPIPGVTKPEWFINTATYNKFLTEIVKNTTPQSRGLSLFASASKSKGFTRFQLGMYNVGLCSGVVGITEFLETHIPSERPMVSDELLVFFRDTYDTRIGAWSFAVCVFSGTENMKSQPIAYEYTPNDDRTFFYPTMDSHDGTAPKKERVERDHSLITPTQFNQYYEKNDFFSQEVPEFIMNQAYHSHEDDGRSQNGDTIFEPLIGFYVMFGVNVAMNQR